MVAADQIISRRPVADLQAGVYGDGDGSIYFGSAIHELMDSMISGFLPSMNFLKPCCEYLSPSSWFSSTPAALFSLRTLRQAVRIGDCFICNHASSKIKTRFVHSCVARRRAGGNVRRADRTEGSGKGKERERIERS